MLKVRVIPVLFLMNGNIVRSEGFEHFKIIGNPVSEVARYSQWRADELIYIDITRDSEYFVQRQEHKDRIASDLLPGGEVLGKAEIGLAVNIRV